MGLDTKLTRKQFLLTAIAGAGALAASPEAKAEMERLQEKAAAAPDEVTLEDLAAMERAIGFPLSADERKAALAEVRNFKKGYETVRSPGIANSVAPPIPFVPFGRQPKTGRRTDVETPRPRTNRRPVGAEDVAFLPAVDLAHLVRTRQITASELTEIYLGRLETYGPKLLNAITITAETARRQAKKADEEIRRDRYRGPLHGIPYVIKDLFAAKGYPTTWGAEPYAAQVLDYDAAVVEKLEEAGAVLCAKTSVGALAMDDHWFKGKTKNPWNPAQGSSGSSAGSASCMAAGLAAFTIGTETLGSIMSPSHRCRVTGLRPTFGRVSRYGAMALSWTMDKVGPICRTAEDCALVLAAIAGADPRDLGTVDRPYRFRSDVDLAKLKIGYLSDDRALDEDDTGNGPDDALELLRKLGAKPQPIQFAKVPDPVTTVLSVEAAAAFEDIARDGRVNTIKNSFWPGIFRAHQFVTGVGYLQAMRARQIAMERFEKELADFDVIVAGDRGSYLLITTNLTGHPQLYIPFGLDKNKNGRGVSLIGRLYDEGTILAVGAKIQRATAFWQNRPDLSVF